MKRERNTNIYLFGSYGLLILSTERPLTATIKSVCLSVLVTRDAKLDPRTFTRTTIGPTGLQDVSFEYAIW